MRWIARLVAFGSSLCLGTSAWLILSKKIFNAPQTVQMVVATTVASAEIPKPSEPKQEEDSSIQSIRFGPVEPIVGNANVRTILLRDVPDVNAPVVSKIQVGEYEAADVLGSSGNFLHVKFPANDDSDNDGVVREHDYEGWADWHSVVSEMSAIVM